MNDDIVNAIIKHLGGGDFMHLTGAKVWSDDRSVGIDFRNSRNKDKELVNLLTVTPEPNGTYTMQFGMVRHAQYSKVKVAMGVTAENMIRVFESSTGLQVTL